MSFLWLNTADALLNQGRLKEALEALTEVSSELSNSFMMTRTSTNRLWWLDLKDFESKSEQVGEVFTRRHILASAALEFECFGSKLSWIPGFLRHAIEACSVGLVQDGKVVAACLTGTSQFPAIWSISVEKKRRQQGWGGGLLSHSLTRLKRAGHKTVVSHIREANITSTRLFQKMGFQRVDALDDLYHLGRTAGCLRKSSLTHVPNLTPAKVERACLEEGIKVLQKL